MAQSMRIFDNHLHLSPTGQGVDAAKLFEESGGTALVLTHMPYHDIHVRAAKDYETAFRRTLDMGKAVRNGTGLKVYVAVGPYPVELIRLIDSVGREKAIETHMEAMDMAGRLFKEGEIIAIGEIGRAHFPVEADKQEACNEVMRYGMKVAKEVGCAVVLHTEAPTPAVCEELAGFADSVGLPREKVVKHFSGPIVKHEDNRGLMPSVLSREENIVKAVQQGDRFFMETDYMDDPRRPGAVLSPATVPKRTKALIERGIMSEDVAKAVHEDWPFRIYGIET